MSQHFPRLHFFLLELAILIRFGPCFQQPTDAAANTAHRPLLTCITTTLPCAPTHFKELTLPFPLLQLRKRVNKAAMTSVGREESHLLLLLFRFFLLESQKALLLFLWSAYFTVLFRFLILQVSMYGSFVYDTCCWILRKLIFHAAKIFHYFHTRQIHRICNIKTLLKTQRQAGHNHKYTFT